MSTTKNVFSRKKNSPRSRDVTLLTNSGMGIMVILITLVVSSIALLGMISTASVKKRSQSQSYVPTQLLQIRGNIANLLRNSNSWTYTYQNPANTNLNCVNTGGNCTAYSNTFISVINDAKGNAVYSLNNSPGWTLSNGMTPAGSSCTTYPSIQCPFAFSVKWKCTTSCTAPPYDLSFEISLNYNPQMPNPNGAGTILSPDAVIINSTKYTATFFSQSSTNNYFASP